MAEMEIPEALECMARARELSVSIREILLPDEVWTVVRDSPVKGDGSSHVSVSLLALARGYLGNVVQPLERFLICEGAISERAHRQYVSDLGENWLVEPEPHKRHRLVEIFYGRLCELQLAFWLEQRGWRIEDMECWRASHDIISEKNGSLHVIEAKHIGQEQAEFDGILQAGRGQPSGFWRGFYDSCDYLQLRALDLAEQLRDVKERRVAALVLSHSAVSLFESMLETEFLDFRAPKLHRKGQTQGMIDLIRSYDELGDIDCRVASWPAKVNELWVIGADERFEFKWLARVGSPASLQT